MEGTVELTDIQRFYKNGTVFLTGATGFIGKLVLEKVLRSLPVKKVFVLIRRKKEKPATQRLEEMFQSPAFDLIKRTNPEVLGKVEIMEGDCSLPMLGMSQDDQKTFIEEVDVVFHVAACVRFDDHIKNATLTNVRATKDLITLAKQIKNMKTFVYTGTGFSNCPRGEIKEEVYPARISAESLITVCEHLNDDCLESMTKTLIGEWPNTYTFTKQVAEDYISREAKGIPICINRPTIVVSTMSEPVAAFVDNVFTLAGFVLANGVGFNRVSYYKPIALDMVPADLVVNESIATGWQTGKSFKPDKAGTPVYNISSVLENPITHDFLFDLCEYNAQFVPTVHQTTYPFNIRTYSKYAYLFLRFIFHTLIGYIFDIVLKLQGKKPMYAKAYEKLHRFQESYEYFVTNAIHPHVENTHKMLRQMSFRDRQMFNCDVTTINWEGYFSQYLKGIRFYLLKDTMDTVPEGRKKINRMKKVFFASVIGVIVVLYVLGKIVLFRAIPLVFGIVVNFLRNAVC